MKRTCNGCIASDPISYSCSLRYKIKRERINILGSILEKVSPAENCPKPLTIKSYIKLTNKK